MSNEAFEKVWLPYELPKNYVSRPDLIASYFWQAAQADQAKRVKKLEAKLEQSDAYIKKMDSVIDGKGIIKSCINPLVDLTNSVDYMVKTMADQAEYIALIELNNKFKDDNNAQLQLDNEKLRETLLQASRQLDLHEPCSTMCRIVSEVLFTTQPESQPESTIRNNRTAQEPLSDEEINTLWYESNNDVLGVSLGYTTQQHYFARAIEKRIRTGEQCDKK